MRIPFPALSGEGARSVISVRPSPVTGVRRLASLELVAVLYASDAPTGTHHDDAVVAAGISEVVSRLSVFGVERYGAMLWGEDLAECEGRPARYALWPDAARLAWARVLAFGMDVRVNIADSTVVSAGPRSDLTAVAAGAGAA